MNKLKLRRQVVQTFLMSIVPVTVNLIVQHYFENLLFYFQILITIASYILAALCVYLYNKFSGRSKRFRKYGKYEGYWIEVIPSFSRSISICKIYFKKNEYHFDGINFDIKTNNTVEFNSKTVIPDNEKSFYYITESNAVNKIEGFGKVYSLPSWPHNNATAKGYFFDVTTNVEQVHETKMVRFDKNFCTNKLKKRNTNINKLSEKEIYELSKDYIIKNYGLETT